MESMIELEVWEFEPFTVPEREFWAVWEVLSMLHQNDSDESIEDETAWVLHALHKVRN